MTLRRRIVWILDSAYRDGGIDLWTKDGTVTKTHYDYQPPFYIHFHNPHAHQEMIEALEERYGAEECTIKTVFGELPGYAVTAGRDVAEAIERQAQFDIDIFNVDVRRDQRFMAERGIFPCEGDGDDRFSPEITHNLTVMEISIQGNPALSSQFTEIEVKGIHTERLTGENQEVLAALFGLVSSLDPDVILMPDADTWMPKIRKLAKQYDLLMPFSRNGKVPADGRPLVLELRKDGTQGIRAYSGRAYPDRYRTVFCLPGRRSGSSIHGCPAYRTLAEPCIPVHARNAHQQLRGLRSSKTRDQRYRSARATRNRAVSSQFSRPLTGAV